MYCEWPYSIGFCCNSIDIGRLPFSHLSQAPVPFGSTFWSRHVHSLLYWLNVAPCFEGVSWRCECILFIKHASILSDECKKTLRCLESPKLTLRSLNFAALDRIFYDYTSSPSWMQQETGNDKFVLLRSSISALSSAFTLFWLFYFKTFERKQVLTTPVQIVLFLFVQSVPITFAPSWGDPYIIRVPSNTIRCLFVSIWRK